MKVYKNKEPGICFDGRGIFTGYLSLESTQLLTLKFWRRKQNETYFFDNCFDDALGILCNFIH